MPRKSALAAILCALATIAAADGSVIEATGEAQIQGGNTVAAKQQALADAMKRAIEKVVGITVQSDFSATQQEVVRGNQDQFYSAVKDSITQKSEGFIQKYDVVSEGAQGTVYKITIRAQVFESKVRAEVQKLADLIAAAGNPKLMLVIQEVYVAEGGKKKRVAKESQVGAYLEKELLARGFELRGAKAAAGVADDSIDTYDKWLADAGGAAQMARDNGADILIAGRVEISNHGVITAETSGGLAALEGQTRIEIASVIRGINASSGDVLSSKPVQMVSMGTSEERAVHRAFQGKGQNVVKQTFDDLLESLKAGFKKAADQGQAYVVALRGVTSFRKQGQGFLEALKKIGGVSDVRQKSFADGQLIIDVAFKGSTTELQERIFKITEKQDGFGTLDVVNISGKQLSFKL